MTFRAEPGTPAVAIDWASGRMQGALVKERAKTLGQLQGLFQDVKSWRRMDPNTIVYTVQWWSPVPEDTEGGLLWGSTRVEPGRVGDEYFMTHGHLHAKRDRAEYYATVLGQGMLILMDDAGRTWTEAMMPGSLHYISANVAHRVANTGYTPLTFAACWPSDAGHDYEIIQRNGFGARLLCRQGVPVLVESQS